MNREKSYSLTVYLTKERIKNFSDALEKPMHKIIIDKDSELYFSKSFSDAPKWAAFFEGHTLDGLYSANASAIFLLNIKGRIFAIPFGPAGRHYLKKGTTEERFGLRATLNSVREGFLRSIDATSLGNEGMQVRTQSARPNPSDVFGLDIERDLVNSVTGELGNIEGFGKTISGRDALHISAQGGLKKIKGQLAFLLEQSAKDTYKAEFEWIDNLAEITDTERIVNYNLSLIEKINNDAKPGKVWLAIPEMIDWHDHSGFKYANTQKAPLIDDIYLGNFKAHLDKEQIELDDLKTTKVHRFLQSNEYARDHWRVYDCIYFELEVDGETLFLSGGKWYRVKSDIVKDTNTFINKLPTNPEGITFPEYKHTSENAYNQELAKINHGQCVDAKKIMIEKRSSFEFCDVYTKNKQLIHVKIYSRSSVLSHLFSQGFVSASLMGDEDFRIKINQKLEADLKLHDTSKRIEVGEYSVVYGIITSAEKNFDLPFFSKLTLMHAAKDLGRMGFNVFLVRIIKPKDERAEEI